MLYMIVDAIGADGSVIASYPVTLEDIAGQSVNDDDFIELAKENHESEGLEFSNVVDWAVREPSERGTPEDGPGEQILERPLGEESSE